VGVVVGDIGTLSTLQYPHPVLSEYELPLLPASPSYNVHGFVTFVTRNIWVFQKQLTIVLQKMTNYPRIQCKSRHFWAQLRLLCKVK
jgi:hypothetical protein